MHREHEFEQDNIITGCWGQIARSVVCLPGDHEDLSLFSRIAVGEAG